MAVESEVRSLEYRREHSSFGEINNSEKWFGSGLGRGDKNIMLSSGSSIQNALAGSCIIVFIMMFASFFLTPIAELQSMSQLEIGRAFIDSYLWFVDVFKTFANIVRGFWDWAEFYYGIFWNVWGPFIDPFIQFLKNPW